MNVTDILLDANFDLRIENGDFVAGESTRQHQQLLILTDKGEWKENPTRGVGAQGWLLDDKDGDLNAVVKTEYERDGMRIVAVKGRGFNLQVEAVYE